MDFRVKGMVHLEQILNVAGLTTIDNDLKVTGKITHRKPVESITTGTVTLTTAQSGTTFYVSQETADIIINLPDNPTIGTYYKFVTDGAVAHTHKITINSLSTTKFNGIWSHASGNDIIDDDTIEFTALDTNKGDFITIEAITTSIWHTYACSSDNGAFVFT